MTECSKCEGTGWKPVMVDGERRVTPCECKQRARLEAEKLQPGGFIAASNLVPGLAQNLGSARQPNGPELVEAALARHAGDLTPEEIQIARLIGRRVGQAAAIRIRDLIDALGGGSTDRDIKGMVERLRTIAKLPIAATKAPPYGYFIPGTAREVDDAHDRYMQEGIKLIVLAQNFREDKDLVQRLRGQLEL